MRILLLVDCYLPSTKSSAKLIHDLAVEFRRRGHEPVIVAPDNSLRRRCDVRGENGVTVVRIRTGPIKGAPLAGRFLNEWRLSSTVWRAARDLLRRHPCDLIVFYSPTIFFAPLVQRLKRLWGCPAYLILRDIFPQWTVDAGLLRAGSLTHRILSRMEAKQYATADVIGVQSPANLNYFRDGFGEKTPSNKPLEVLFNWTALDEPTEPVGFRRQLGLNGKVVFLYGGNMGIAQDMGNLVRLAAALRDQSDVHFLLVGEGTEMPRLHDAVAHKRLENVTIHPAVSQEQYLALVAEFDVGLITLDRNLRTHNFPGKLLSYLYHGLPILASINQDNDLQKILEEAEAGLVCVNGDDALLQKYAVRLAADTELRKRLGRNAHQLSRSTFSVNRAADRVLAHLC